MSYDLFFRPRPGARPPTLEAFRDYLAARPKYLVRESEAVYDNPDTGIYFSFFFDAEPDPEADTLPCAFNLNYFRPHTFALEAADELEALIAHFDLLVSDPQFEGLGEGEYTRAGFLAGWNQGNQFAARHLFKHAPAQPLYTLPAHDIERHWRWNYRREALQSHYGETIFVPRVFFIAEEGVPTSLAVWGDAIPVALPRVDQVMILYPDFNAAADERPPATLLPWDVLAFSLTPFKHYTEPAEHWLVEQETLIRALMEQTRQLPRLNRQLQGIAPDQILDQELTA